MTQYWTPQPELQKIIKIDLTNPSDRIDVLVGQHGFVGIGGINVNKNGDGLIVLDGASSKVGFFNFDLELQEITDLASVSIVKPDCYRLTLDDLCTVA